jgi:mevalonate pyrophosphate decarboxylase
LYNHQPETIETYPDSLELSNIAQIISGSMSRETTETYPDSLELSNIAQIISGSMSRETIETYPDSLELSNIAQTISGSMVSVVSLDIDPDMIWAILLSSRESGYVSMVSG